MAEEAEQRTTYWGTTILTAIVVLGSVGFGVWIYWRISSKEHANTGAPPDLTSKIAQIRGYIRAANRSSSAAEGLAQAGAARALLDDARSAYGAAFSRVCDTDKLYALIQKVQDRHSGALALPGAA
jgi:hypothetical protein